MMTTDVLDRRVSFDTTDWTPRLAVIGFVPQEFGCCLSRRQQSRRSEGKFARGDRPSRTSCRSGTRRACRLDKVVKQITRSDNTLTVSYCTKWGPYQSADIATTICGPGQFVQAHKFDGWVAWYELGTHNCFIRRPANRLLA